MRRRLKSAALVLISQILLIALAIAWLIHMSIIAAYGSIFFVEENPFILWGEILASFFIAIFAIYVLANQIKRLGERRASDRSMNLPPSGHPPAINNKLDPVSSAGPPEKQKSAAISSLFQPDAQQTTLEHFSSTGLSPGKDGQTDLSPNTQSRTRTPSGM